MIILNQLILKLQDLSFKFAFKNKTFLKEKNKIGGAFNTIGGVHLVIINYKIIFFKIMIVIML